MKNNTKDIQANSVFSKEDTLIAKAIAILLMLAHHLFAFPDRIQGVQYISLFSYNGVGIEQYVGFFGKICVAVFMFLSGYGAFLSLSKSDHLTSGILSKIKRLYTEYWKVFAVFIPIGLILGVERIVPETKAFVLNVLAINPSYNGEWWFITPYLVTLILFPVVLRVINRKYSSILVDVFLTITLAVFVQNILPEIMGLRIFAAFSKTLYYSIISSTLSLLPQFIMGCIFAKYNVFTAVWDLFRSKTLLFAVSFIFLLSVFCIRIKHNESLDYLFAPVFIWTSVSIFRNIAGLNKFLIVVGKKSTGMWLIHSFYCYLFCQSFVFLPEVSVLILIWLAVLSYCSSWVLDYIFNNILKITKRIRIK